MVQNITLIEMFRRSSRSSLLASCRSPPSVPFPMLYDEDTTPETFTKNQNRLLLMVTMIESSMSFVGSTLIVLSWVKFPSLRKFSLKLVLMLAVSDIGSCLSYFLGNPSEGSALCYSQALMMSFFELASILWTTVIAFTLFRLIILLKPSNDLMTRFHLYGWGIPFVCTVLPLTTGSYGASGAWCWIKDDSIQGGEDGPSDNLSSSITEQGNIWRVTTFYLPLWLAIVFNSVMYLIVTNTLSRIASTRSVKMVKRLRLYPLILVFCWMGATINRLQNVISPNEPVFSLYLLRKYTENLSRFPCSPSYPRHCNKTLGP